MKEIKGVWRTVGGRRIFIKDGQDLASTMRESGKFNNKEKNTIESFKCLEKYKDMSDEEFKRSYTSKNDYIMEEMAQENGFDKLPIKFSKNDYDKLIREGCIRVQRVVSDNGMNTAEYYANEFKNGKYYATASANMFGNGIYTSGDLKDIDTYSKRDRNSEVIHIAIDKNAKIKKFKNQEDIFKYTVNELRNIPSNYQRIFQEPGKILISKGYDASYIENMNYYIIYNRGILYVEEKL